MRVLILGAGAIGGYFGGRMLQAGRDVTFLVRPGRAAQLARDGLVVRSQHGDLQIPEPPHILGRDIAAPYDLILLSCKAYDLDDAISNIRPAIGPDTVILPLLNGMRHLDVLDEQIGPERVLGGQCVISATLDPQGRVIHLGELHALSFGEQNGGISARASAIDSVLQGCGFNVQASGTVLLDMWEKWVALASLAGITCLMRATIGDVVTSGGQALILELLEECRATAEAAGYKPRPAFMARITTMLTAADSPLTASMLRDVEGGYRVEAEHILGDLLRRREALVAGKSAVLGIAYRGLKAYEARRSRQMSA